MSSIYDFEAQQINGQDVSLSDYRGKVLLIVNTASKCGFTPQFGGLEELHKAYTGKGLVVLGFPWNFTKFLVGKDGQVIRRYAPTDKPADLAKDVEAALAA